MQILEIILLIVAMVYALSWIYGIRRYVSSGQGITRQTVNTAMLFVSSVVYVIFSGDTPYSLLWMFPLSWLIGTLSLTFPFSMLWTFGNTFKSVCLIGLDTKTSPTTNSSSRSTLKENQSIVGNNMQARVTQIIEVMYKFDAYYITNHVFNKKAFKKISDLQKDNIIKLFISVTALNTIRYFYENILVDQDSKDQFEKYFYVGLEQKLHFDVAQGVADFVKYVSKREPSAEIQYIGFRTMDILGHPDAIFAFEISSEYANRITGNKAFYKLLVDEWSKLD